MHESFSFLLVFSITAVLFGYSFFYCLWSLVARRWIRPDWYRLFLFMTTGFLVAVITEPIHDFIYRYLTGEFLWIYQVFPVFGGGSSGLALLVWPIYGWHTYFWHEAMHIRGYTIPTWLRSIFPGIDGVPFDMIANLASLAFFGTFFFYYPDPRLWHLSSLWVIPFYVVSGILYRITLDFFLKKQKNHWLPISCYLGGIGGMGVGEMVYKNF